MREEHENGSDGMRTGGDEGETLPTAVVRTVGGELEAEAIRTALESAGIPVRVKMESVAKLIAVTVDGLGKVELLVPHDRLEEAREILAAEVDQDELVEKALAGDADNHPGGAPPTDAQPSVDAERTSDGPEDGS